MRYVGQEHSVPVALNFDLSSPQVGQHIHDAFQAAYERVYGYTLPAAVDIVNVRVKAVGSIPKPTLPQIPAGNGDPRRARKASRCAHDFLDGQQREFIVYERALLRANDLLRGLR